MHHCVVEAAFARVHAVVEGARIEPETVEGTAETVAFEGRKKAAVFEVVFPLFERVDVFPFGGDAADFDYLLEERVGKWDGTKDVGRLAGVVGYQLDGVLERAVLGFGGEGEDCQFGGVGEDLVETVGGAGEVDDVVDGIAGAVDLEDELGCQRFEMHGWLCAIGVFFYVFNSLTSEE